MPRAPDRVESTVPPPSPGSPGPGSPLRLGTFLGVFTPTVLTILGAMMYLRIGWVVGNGGLGGALAIVVLSNAITLVTGLSLSALSTNMRVGVGGAYYLISRSLGLELGGALGIPLYLSQVLSITMYAYALAETARFAWPGAPVELLAALIILGVLALAQRSTVLALKAQLPIMALIALSILSLVLGEGGGAARVPFAGGWEDGGFWAVFAVFFPAVTGVLAGVGMSGDLADPGRSIPRGVLAAVGVGFVVYMGIPVVLAHGADPAELRSDPLIWTKLARFGWLVLPGMWGAILSSAIGSVLTAPRTLQALAGDHVVPTLFSRTDEAGEPVFALRFSGGIALAAVLLGDLNAVATVVTMFFLTTYGMLNLAAALEELVKDPSFRPRIRVPWWVSLAGAVGCFVAMAAINPGALLVALLVEGAIWWWLNSRVLRAAWGDLRTGLWFALARASLLRIHHARRDPRNWRPHVLVFTRDLERSLGMVELAAHFSQDRGIVTVATLLQGDPRELHPVAERLAERNAGILDEAGIMAFPEAITVPDLETGFAVVAQANGYASLASNVVMFGWPEDDAGLARLLREVRYLAELDKSTVIVRPSSRPRRREDADIVVWWKGREHNGDLMLLFAWLLSLGPGWGGRRIVLKSVVDDEEEARAMRTSCRLMLDEIRIDARVEVAVRPRDRDVAEVIRQRSRDAELVFLGLAIPGPGEEAGYASRVRAMLEDLPTAVLVRNAGPFRGMLV